MFTFGALTLLISSPEPPITVFSFKKYRDYNYRLKSLCITDIGLFIMPDNLSKLIEGGKIA